MSTLSLWTQSPRVSLVLTQTRDLSTLELFSGSVVLLENSTPILWLVLLVSSHDFLLNNLLSSAFSSTHTQSSSQAFNTPLLHLSSVASRRPLLLRPPVFVSKVTVLANCRLWRCTFLVLFFCPYPNFLKRVWAVEWTYSKPEPQQLYGFQDCPSGGTQNAVIKRNTQRQVSLPLGLQCPPTLPCLGTSSASQKIKNKKRNAALQLLEKRR